jgi:hypothetical protein
MRMGMISVKWPRAIRRIELVATICLSLGCCGLTTGCSLLLAQTPPQSGAPAKTPPAVGTVKSIAGNTIVLANESGAETKVQISAEVKYLRVPPGSKDLKEATPIQLSDLQPGDRILVRGKAGGDPGTFVAATVISMKKADLDEKQTHEREEWQRHGTGGLVKSVDPATGVVIISTMSATGSKDVEVHIGKSTVVRRYAPSSVKFDDAKASSLAEIVPGDQLRARGTRSEDGATFTADEIVTGSFRNIAGTVSAIDTSAGTMTVLDLSNNKPVEVKVTGESQLRKLPQPMAQRVAMRLKGVTPDAGTAGAGAAAGRPAGTPRVGAANGTGGGPPQGGQTSSGGSQGGMGSQAGAGRAGGGDLQQMLSRLPATPFAEFQKGDAVMIVATSSGTDSKVVAITLLGGVEPILQASPQGQAASILTPWSLSNGGGDAGTP